MSNLRLFDEQAALNHVKTLNFKRHAATEGENKTINYIKKELDKENVNLKIESFTWTKTQSKLRKLIFLWIFIIVLSCQIVLLNPMITWLILPIYGIFFLVLIFGGKFAFDRSRILYIGKKRESKNVITTIQAKDLYPKRPVIIFSAHHDSVSTNFPFKLLIIIFISLALLFLSYLLVNFILSIWSLVIIFSPFQIDIIYLWIRNISFIFGIIILVEIFILFFRKKTNVSVGSIDNASGVAILLELAKLINKNPLEKTDVILLWSGAEEMGIWGSKQYCAKRFEELDHDYNLDKSYNINVDMVGSSISIVDKTGLIRKKKLNDNLNDVLEASISHQNVPFKKANWLVGAGSDHLIFQAFTKKANRNGFQVACFMSKEDSKYIHSKKDTPEKCSDTNLNASIDLCYNAIKSLDLRVE